MLIRIFSFIIIACLSFPVAAADWLRAESEHYVVHAKLEEADLRELVQLAERFDQLLKGRLPSETNSGRKLELYLEQNDRRISRVSPFRNIGFARSDPEFAISFALYDPKDDELFRNYTLFYAQSVYHIDSSFFRPNPVWIRTGVPLFFATTYVSEEGDFILGAPDIRRPLKRAVTASKLDMLLSTTVAPQTSSAWGRFYGLSREAVRPLLMEMEYTGLLEKYLDSFAAGAAPSEAGELLGDLETLATQIEEHRKNRAPEFRRVTLAPTPPAKVSIRPMRKDEIALVEPRFQRLRRDNSEKAAVMLEKLTKKHAESSPVWFEFAAAEFARVQSSQFGGEPIFRGFGFSNGELIVSASPYSDEKAWAAVNRAVELDPDNSQAIRLKAEILLSRLVKTGDLDDAQAYDKVRAMLAPMANTPESEPLAAALYFQSFIEQDVAPPNDALELLGRAFVANPGVEEFRYAYAVALSRNGQTDVARNLLRSMLNNPEYADAAARALNQTP